MIPIDGILEPAYQTLLSHKLFITPASFGRIVILPSAASKGEIAIAVYSKPAKDSENVLITCTRAKKNLWYAASNANAVPSANTSQVEVARHDAPFPKSTAMIIFSGIRKMISQCKPLDKTNETFVDETDIEVVVESSPNRFAQGLLTSHARGKNGTALRGVTHLLEAYCEAKMGDRKQLLKEIEAKAKQLLN